MNEKVTLLSFSKQSFVFLGFSFSNNTNSPSEAAIALKDKKKIEINDEVVNLELKRKYQIDLSSMKEEHKERIDSLKKLTSENIQKDVFFSELVKFLNVKVEQKELQEYIQKYYGEKIDQRTAETAYGTLLRNKIADESMKTFKIKETKLSLEQLMKKGSHNHESGTHSH